MGILNRYCQSETKPGLVKVDVERFGADRYRAPTDEEREQFKAEQAAQKKAKAAKRKANPAPKLINPTDEDAAKLQAIWNARATESVRDYNKRQGFDAATDNPQEVLRVTQAQYSARSKGSYASFQTISVMANGLRDDSRSGRTTTRTAPIAFKVRKAYASGSGYTRAADRVIVITDKPQKPLPLDWANLDRKDEETAPAVAE